MTLTVGSLFSGVGGFDLGFERAGMAVRWQCEKDTAARSVLRRHWPDVTVYEDVRDVGIGAEAVDVVCGGFPCQDVSIAGRRAGLAGERSGLWFEFHRILGELAPQWVVIENVPGLLFSNGGRDFATILRGLVELGYGVCWRVLDSQHFGVPQRRRRVFIVGHLADGRAAEVLFERESGGGHSAPGGEARQAPAASPRGIAGTVSSKWAKGSGGPAGDEAYNLVAVDFRHQTLGDLSPTLQAKSTGGYSLNYTPGVMGFSWQAGTGMAYGDECSPSLLAGQHPAVVGTLRASGAGSSQPSGQANEADMLVGGDDVRRLTPLECERLQGFTDGWTAGQSDTARYRQMGNAVTVNVAEWIGRRIVEAAQVALQRLGLGD